LSADYYKVLGVDADADQKVIKSAYRRLARRYHPDVARGRSAASKFLLIQEAYEVLSDLEKRQQYDRALSRRSLRWQPSRPQPRSSDVRRPESRRTRVIIDLFGVRFDGSFRKN
jgi:DnaJ-class molecular chaperone